MACANHPRLELGPERLWWHDLIALLLFLHAMLCHPNRTQPVQQVILGALTVIASETDPDICGLGVELLPFAVRFECAYDIQNVVLPGATNTQPSAARHAAFHALAQHKRGWSDRPRTKLLRQQVHKGRSHSTLLAADGLGSEIDQHLW